MTTRIVRLLNHHVFGLVENPLWQIAKVADRDKASLKIDPWTPCLIPLDTFSAEKKANAYGEFQTFLSLENLTNNQLLNKLENNQKVQIWVDRVISIEEASMLDAMFNAYQNIDLVYLPDLHFHPEQVFENLQLLPRLLIHMKLKRTSFERWLTPFEMWDRISWLKQSERFTEVGLQILETQIGECISKTELLFLLNPTYENMMLDLRTREKIQYWIQASAKTILNASGPEYSFLFRQVIWTILRPNRRNWLALYDFAKLRMVRVYNLLKIKTQSSSIKLYWIMARSRNARIFYPVRKTYWILEHGINKRILGKKDESDQCRDSSYKV